jgi:hypothetical protein
MDPLVHNECSKLWRALAQQDVRTKWSWPFMNPVNTESVKDYIAVVKKPMDLRTVKKNLALRPEAST